MWQDIFKFFLGIPKFDPDHQVSPDLDFEIPDRPLTRREHFYLSKKRREKMRHFYYQYGQPVSISSWMDDYSVEFEYLYRGIRLEDVPTECAGVSVKVSLYYGDEF